MLLPEVTLGTWVGLLIWVAQGAEEVGIPVVKVQKEVEDVVLVGVMTADDKELVLVMEEETLEDVVAEGPGG